MAQIEKRRQRKADGSLGAKKYRVRYTTPDGTERSKTYDKFDDAKKFAATTEADKARGAWIDPRSGKATFREYAEQWRALQVHSQGTTDQIEVHMRRHVYPVFGDKPLTHVSRSMIQAWVKDLSTRLAPATVEVVFGWVRTIFKSAVMDDRIAKSPCFKIALPRIDTPEVVPPSTEEVEALLASALDWMRGPIITAAGSGLRWGETFGLTTAEVDFMRERSLRVEKQLICPTKGAPYLGAPKTESSKRTVPLPTSTLTALSAHLAAFPVTHEWQLLFTNEDGDCVTRKRWSEKWTPAMKRADLLKPDPRDSKRLIPQFTFHGLRHYYASLLIRHGESVVTVQKRLGHKTPEETLRTYIHLWPDSEERTRAAIDEVWSTKLAVAL